VAGLSLITAAFVLDRRAAAADGWSAYQLFAAEQGPLQAMRRERRQAPAAGAPDLFDEIEAHLESSNQGRSWFLTESRVRARAAGIGRSYEALRCASALARVVLRNPVAPDGRPAVYALLGEALAAFGQGLRPDIVLFKAVFRLARGEGYPVKQEWLAQLPADESAAAEDLLARPVRGAAADPVQVARWQRSLDDYLRGRAEFDIE
jgi:hypothetical protein